MKKIMFNSRYGLEQAVLDGRKTLTRRPYKAPANSYGGLEIENNSIITFDADGNEIVTLPQYKVGEVVAVAQSYKDVFEWLAKKGYDAAKWMDDNHITKNMAGWLNKMFVRSDLMIFKIRITNVRIERLQDISDADCMAEGVLKNDKNTMKYYINTIHPNIYDCFITPRDAYAALIDKISGRGTWNKNPYVFVYEFELIK